MSDSNPSPEHDETAALSDRPVWEEKWFQITLAVLVLAVTLGVIMPPILAVIYKVRGVLVPVLLAIGLAYVFNPVVTYLQDKRNVSRATSSGLIIGAFAFLMLVLTLLIVPPVVVQGANLFHSLKTRIPQLLIDEANKQAEIHEKRQTALEDDPAPTPGSAAENTSADAVDSAADADQASETSAAQVVAEAVGTALDNETTTDAATESADAPPADAEAAGGFRQMLRDAFSENPQDREQFLRSLAETIKTIEPSTLATGVTSSLDVGTSVVTSVVGLISYLAIATLITCFAFYFFSWKFHGLLQWCVPFIPETRRERTLDILKKMNNCTTAFIRGRLIQSFVMGAILSIGWAITGVPYWLLLGVAGGLLNLIPFAGFFVWPVAIALTWLDHVSGGSGFSLWAVLIWPSVVYGIAQGLDGWVIEPVVQGQATNLNPLAVFLAVMVGGSIAGLLGMLLAIPAAACIKILLDEVILPELRRLAANRKAAEAV